MEPIDDVQPGWEFFAYRGGVLEVAREREAWRLRAAGREQSHRRLDSALTALLDLGEREIARLMVRILLWEVEERVGPGMAEATEPDAAARLVREVESLRRLIDQEEAKGTPDSLVARAARGLLGERLAGEGER